MLFYLKNLVLLWSRNSSAAVKKLFRVTDENFEAKVLLKFKGLWMSVYFAELFKLEQFYFNSWQLFVQSCLVCIWLIYTLVIFLYICSFSIVFLSGTGLNAVTWLHYQLGLFGVSSGDSQTFWQSLFESS